MKNNIMLSLCVVSVLSGCTATNKFKGPNYTFDDLDHSTTIPQKEISTSYKDNNKDNNNKDNAPITATIYQNCSEAHSVHSPIIWIPVVGPTIDLLLIPSVSELSGQDAWSLLPLIGPPITYIKGTQYCVYNNLSFGKSSNKSSNKSSDKSSDESSGPKLEDSVTPALVKEAIAVSDKNCYAYQHTLIGGFNELDANQKFLSDAALMTQTGASFANPVAGAVVGGLKQAITSANDAIKTSFFVSYGAHQLFENIGSVRKTLITDLTTQIPNETKTENTDETTSKWGYNSKNGMPYADLRRFMAVYDNSCSFEQAINDLNLVTDKGQAGLNNTANTAKTPDNKTAPNTAKTSDNKTATNTDTTTNQTPTDPTTNQNTIQQDILINNKATTLQ